MHQIIRLIILVGVAALAATSCRKESTTVDQPATEAETRKAAEAAIGAIISQDTWRRNERSDRAALSQAKTLGEVELARVDLDTTMANAKEAASKHEGALNRLHEITNGKPPYWQAVEGFKSAVGMANDDERNRLRMLSLDQVVKEFGVEAAE